jgi:hypothetical protein
MDCSSTTLTWAWNSVVGATTYEILDTISQTAVISGIPGGTLTTVEINLQPNATYYRHIRSHNPANTSIQNCASTFTTTSMGGGRQDGAMYIGTHPTEVMTMRGYAKFDIGGLLQGTEVTDMRLFCFCFDYDEEVDINFRGVGLDPATAPCTGLDIDYVSTDVFLFNASTIGHGCGSKIVDFYPAAVQWVEDAIAGGFGWCAFGAGHNGSLAIDNWCSIVNWDNPTEEWQPRLEVTYLTPYSDNSATVEACTLAAVPFMEASPTTFPSQSTGSIQVQVGVNGNPPGTVIELFYAEDADGGPGTFYSCGTQSSGYNWNIADLSQNMPYWFKSRARNWSGVWSGYCSHVKWTTNHIYTQTLPSKGYHMLNLPADTGSQTFNEIFGDDCAPKSPYIAAWNEMTNSWGIVNNNTSPEPDRGYLIYSWEPDTVLTVEGQSLNGSGNKVILLTCSGDDQVVFWGFTLVRNPFSSEVSWIGCSRASCDPTHWRPLVGNEYEWFLDGQNKSTGGTDTIPPGASFWVHATSAIAQITVTDPASNAPKALPEPAVQWRVRLSAITGSYGDTQTYFGVRENSLDGLDGYDIVEIAPCDIDYIQACFRHDDWDRFSGPYTQDMKGFPSPGETLVWNLSVHATNADGMAGVSWEIPDKIKGNWKLLIRDDGTGAVKDMLHSDSYEYPAGGEDSRNFTIRATQLEAVLFGDSDRDGEVTEADAAACARSEHGLETLSTQQLYISDMNSDGKVDAFDALLIMKKARGHLSK